MFEQRITISLSSLLFILLTVLGLVLLWQLRGLLVILMVAVVLAASISPLVGWAERFYIPRWISVIVVYLTGIAVVMGAGLLIGPTVYEQIESLIRQIPNYSEMIRQLVEDRLTRLSNTRPELLSQFLDAKAVPGWIIRPWEGRLASQIAPISIRMGGYIRGRILVSAILGAATTVGLSYLGLREYSLGLGAIAGFTNLIPFLGPILGAIPALVVALSKGGWILLWVFLLFVVIQNVETYVLDPLLVGSSVGVHPLYQLLAVLGGIQVLGIVGALIVPPWFAGVSVLIDNLYLRPKLIAERRAAIARSKQSNIPLPVGSES